MAGRNSNSSRLPSWEDQARAYAPVNLSLWISEARGGSKDALGKILQGVTPYLKAIAAQKLDNALRAKAGRSDLVQETLLNVQRNFLTFRGTSDIEFLAWVRAILINNLITLRRRYRCTQMRHVQREVSLDSQGSAPKEELLQAGGTPSSQVMRAERNAHIEGVISKLPEHYREVIQLRFEGNLTFPEIARRMGRSTGAVTKIFMRAIETLQRSWTGDED